MLDPTNASWCRNADHCTALSLGNTKYYSSSGIFGYSWRVSHNADRAEKIAAGGSWVGPPYYCTLANADTAFLHPTFNT